MIMEAASTSETSVNVYQTIRRYIPEESHLHAVKSGFEVFTEASMKMAVFWVVAPCILVELYQSFRGTYQGESP
jgi:hypothetical protein